MRPLLALFALAVALDGHAANAFKCTNAQGHIAYQQTACVPGHIEQRFEFALEPRVEARPVVAPVAKLPRAQRRLPIGDTDEAPTSYECRVTNGEVFYQHAPCPATVPGVRAAKPRGKGAASGALVVSGRALPRRDACRRIHAAGATTRAGHDRDEDVSTYEKNLGRDPCR